METFNILINKDKAVFNSIQALLFEYGIKWTGVIPKVEHVMAIHVSGTLISYYSCTPSTLWYPLFDPRTQLGLILDKLQDKGNILGIDGNTVSLFKDGSLVINGIAFSCDDWDVLKNRWSPVYDLRNSTSRTLMVSTNGKQITAKLTYLLQYLRDHGFKVTTRVDPGHLGIVIYSSDLSAAPMYNTQTAGSEMLWSIDTQLEQILNHIDTAADSKKLFWSVVFSFGSVNVLTNGDVVLPNKTITAATMNNIVKARQDFLTN